MTMRKLKGKRTRVRVSKKSEVIRFRATNPWGSGVVMSGFNNGNPYHGSTDISEGRLSGSTDATDYFYYLCPKCKNGQILRILNYEVLEVEANHPYNGQLTKNATLAFTLVFHLYCERCKLTDFVKLSNTGWQAGSLSAKD